MVSNRSADGSQMLASLFRKTKTPPWEIPARPGESDQALKERRRQAYCDDQIENSVEWFKRMDFQLDVSGMRVLDLGCGHGALSIGFAERGAASVVGLDLDDDRIDFAKRNLATAYPELADRVSFRCEDVMTLTDQFDLIVSKDAFEHIDDLGHVVGYLHSLLGPGGHLAAGFSPLFFSPFGDHARFKLSVPWAHAVLPESLLVWWLNQRTDGHASNSMDLGLNRMTPQQFRQIFEGSDWDNLNIQYNRGDNPLFPVFRALRHLSPIERFFTTSIYAVARKSTG
jgi:SAM-dependent methyltransferase